MSIVTGKRNIPSFYRDFAKDKVLNNGNYGAFVSHSRASTATYFDSTGLMVTASVNTPRFDHDPLTLESLGLLIEESRDNKLNYSANIGGTNWNVRAGLTLITSSVTSPDGTNTATSCSLTSEDGYLWQSTPASGFWAANTTYTISAYAKAISGSMFISFNAYWFTGSSTNTRGINRQTNGNAIVSSSNWNRYQFTFTTPTQAGGGIGDTGLFISGSGQAAVWGFQFEVGHSASSYIPTTNVTASRAQDFARISGSSSFLTGKNQNTWFVEFKGNPENTQINYGRVITTNTNATLISYEGSPNTLGSWNGTFSGNFGITITSANNYYQSFGKSAITLDYSNPQRVVYANGTASAINNGDTSGFTGSLDIYLGSNAGGGNYLNGWIKRVMYYPTILDSDYLKFLTR